MNSEITQYINEAPPAQREIMETLRGLIHEHVPGTQESFKWSRPVFSTKKDFAYLQANKSHVNLGFYKEFEKMNDPDGRLEGTGKTMRHIKLRSLADIDKGQLAGWLAVAAT